MTNIVPIFKEGAQHDPLKCHPISLTSAFCKTLERVVVGHIYGYLELNSVLSCE